MAVETGGEAEEGRSRPAGLGIDKPLGPSRKKNGRYGYGFHLDPTAERRRARLLLRFRVRERNVPLLLHTLAPAGRLDRPPSPCACGGASRSSLLDTRIPRRPSHGRSLLPPLSRKSAVQGTGLDGARFGHPARVLLDELTTRVKVPLFLSFFHSFSWSVSRHELCQIG